MSKTTTIALALAASLFGANAAMAQSADFNSMVVDYGQAPAASAKAAPAAAAKSRAEVLAELSSAQAAALARADAELGIIPAAGKTARATLLAGK